MATGGRTEEYGVLRVEIEGGWTAAEMAGLFTTLDGAYRVAAAVRTLQPAPLRPAWALTGVDPVVAALLQQGRARYGDLLVNTVTYASPGWVEVLGALNPLAAIERLVNGWRAETSQRDRDETAGKMAREELRLREQQQRMAFLLEVMDRLEGMPPDLREALLARLMELWPERPLAALATDLRVTGVALTPVAVPAR
jgi:hypothetical protein